MKEYICLLSVLMLTVHVCLGGNASHMIELNSNWTYTHFPYCQTDEEALKLAETGIWKPGTVPGDVHLDLMRDGVLPDLYFGQNFYSSVWVENEDFVYRTSFDIPEYTKGNAVYLDFEGLDNFATIWVNGMKVGKTHNMFKTYSFEVSEQVKPTGNQLIIRLASPMKEVYKQVPGAEEEMDKLSCAFMVKERLITRKVQMNYGWDNVPRIITTGIYRPVKLRMCKAASIDNVWFRSSLSADYSRATASAKLSLTGVSRFSGEIEVMLTGPDGETYRDTEKVQFTETKQPHVSTVQLEVPNPKLWWPAGLGDQPLYQLSVNLKKNGEVMDSYSERVGIREIKVVTTPAEKRMVNYRIGNPKKETDVMDGGFVGAWSKVPLENPEEVEVTPLKFYVNGKYVFMKGWDFQPLDVFETTVTREKYYRSVQMVKDAGANMIRVWGGGNVENPSFYDACDEKGILVWQDFFYASGQYPNDDEFLSEIEGETINVVEKLRNRVCLAAWCGDNESDMVNHDRGVGQFANKITHQVQKRVMEQYDPDHYWHPSSPSGGGYPRSPWGGDKRNWGAGFPENDYAYIRGDEARFISEGGASSIAQISTFRQYMPADAEWPVTGDYYNMHWGDVPTMRRDFPKAVLGNISKYFGTASNTQELIYLSQIFQAHGLPRMVQHFRQNKQECGGVLLWKWADTWPSICYSVVDYNEFKKAGWYTVKRAMAPRTLMMRNYDGNLSVWYLNDLGKLDNQQVVCQLKKCDGSLVKEWKADLNVDENSSIQAIDLGIKREDYMDGNYYLKLFVANNPEMAPYYYIPSDMINLKTHAADVNVLVKRKDEGHAVVSFTANQFTPYLLITGNNPYLQLSDNCFFLEKGETRQIEIVTPQGELWGDFSFTWWKGASKNFIIESELLKPVGMKPTVYP